MGSPIQRRIIFTLHFHPHHLHPAAGSALAPLFPANAVITQLELLCDGVLQHVYHREAYNICHEYFCDTHAHSFTLNTLGLVKLSSTIDIPAGTETCCIEAQEDENFLLKITGFSKEPEDLDIMAYDTTECVIEDLISILVEDEVDIYDPRVAYLRISFSEDCYGVYPEPADPKLRYELSRQDCIVPYGLPVCPKDECYKRLSLRNRKHLLRYAYYRLRGCPELRRLRFDWENTYIKVTLSE